MCKVCYKAYILSTNSTNSANSKISSLQQHTIQKPSLIPTTTTDTPSYDLLTAGKTIFQLFHSEILKTCTDAKSFAGLVNKLCKGYLPNNDLLRYSLDDLIALYPIVTEYKYQTSLKVLQGQSIRSDEQSILLHIHNLLGGLSTALAANANTSSPPESKLPDKLSESAFEILLRSTTNIKPASTTSTASSPTASSTAKYTTIDSIVTTVIDDPLICAEWYSAYKKNEVVNIQVKPDGTLLIY